MKKLLFSISRQKWKIDIDLVREKQEVTIQFQKYQLRISPWLNSKIGVSGFSWCRFDIKDAKHQKSKKNVKPKLFQISF